MVKNMYQKFLLLAFFFSQSFSIAAMEHDGVDVIKVSNKQDSFFKLQNLDKSHKRIIGYTLVGVAVGVVSSIAYDKIMTSFDYNQNNIPQNLNRQELQGEPNQVVVLSQLGIANSTMPAVIGQANIPQQIFAEQQYQLPLQQVNIYSQPQAPIDEQINTINLEEENNELESVVGAAVALEAEGNRIMADLDLLLGESAVEPQQHQEERPQVSAPGNPFVATNTPQRQPRRRNNERWRAVTPTGSERRSRRLQGRSPEFDGSSVDRPRQHRNR